MTRKELLTEAAAWRKLAKWVDKNQGKADSGLCCLLFWRVNDISSPLPTLRPAKEMLVRVKGHATMQLTGCYLDSIDPDYGDSIPVPDARVIFCLLMALECEEDRLLLRDRLR